MNKRMALSIENLCKSYSGKIILDNVNFIVYEGDFHAFIGDNGAGKTTTIKCILGLINKDNGIMSSFDIDDSDVNFRNNIGYMPETSDFPHNFTLKRYLNNMAFLYGLNKNEAKKRIEYLSKKFNLHEFLNSKPINFSSGQQKKTLLIQALLNNPNILILDEPSANLDPTTRSEMYEIFKELNEKGVTIFLVTHVLSEVENIANSATILKNGNVLFTGNYFELTKKYPNKIEFVFIDDKNKKKAINILVKNKYTIDEDGSQIHFQNENDIENIIKLLIKNKLLYSSYKVNKLNLNEIYLKLTKT